MPIERQTPSFFFFIYRKVRVHQEKQQRLFYIVVVLESGKKKTVPVKASTQDVAERRALKRTPAAVDIARS
jgi:hypothetical protein